MVRPSQKGLLSAQKKAKLLEMGRDIVQKLAEEFALRITSERQVVYILVELRKLLEKRGTLQSYRALELCCGWAAHSKLDRSSAREVTKLFDRYEAKHIAYVVTTTVGGGAADATRAQRCAPAAQVDPAPSRSTLLIRDQPPDCRPTGHNS
jgi:hypothetical protein